MGKIFTKQTIVSLCLFFCVCPGYIIEKKEKGKEWTKASSFPVPETTYSVIKLTEGSEYEFRVMAVNDGGPGKPSKATPKHIVRDPVCEFISFFNPCDLCCCIISIDSVHLLLQFTSSLTLTLFFIVIEFQTTVFL